MREIKFRAWDKENQCMVDIDFIGKHIIKVSNGEWENIEHFEIMQYTGLKDKNGKEICEGDIFKTSLDVVAVVEWEKEARFLGYTNNRRIIYVNREPQVEVLGNIYENKDLLEVGNE